MGAVACSPPGLAPTRGDRVPERSVDASGVLATFTKEGAHWRSPVLEAPDGATRVGIMLEVHDAADSVVLEARGASAERFEPATWTWAEGNLRVAKVDLAAADFGVELRVADEDLGKVRQLTWSAVVPEPETPRVVDHEIGVRDLGVSRRPLEINGANPRSAWGARPTECSSLNQTKSKISIHHTASPSTPAPDYETRLRGIQAYHMDTRGWCDVGYHFLVTADGRAWEAREARYLGAHVGGNNTNNLGISLVGCFQDHGCNDWQPFTPPQPMLDVTAALVGENAQHYGITISPDTVMGHRDNPGQTTSCPGDNLHALLDDIRSAAGGADFPVDPPPPAETGMVQGVVWDVTVTESAGDALELGARLDDATIECDCGQTATVRADDAYWSLDLAPGTYTFTARAPGFAPGTRTVQVTTGAELWASIGLNPAGETFELTVVVNDAETSAPLEGATVQATGVAPTRTDVDGRARLTLPAGEVTVVASAEDHEPETLVETFEAGANVVRELHLAAVRSEVEQGDPENPGLGEPEVITPFAADGCGCSAGDGDASEPTMAGVLALFALASLVRRRRR
jgi:MYXO-CTERM domain-containing protein